MNVKNCYLTSARLINFQSWEDNVIEFGPGLNVIAARNNVGKSAFFKAVKLALMPSKYDKDDREDFIRKGQRNAIIAFAFSDDVSFACKVTSKDVTYLKLENGEYENYGTETPQELLVRMGSLIMGDTVSNLIDKDQDMFMINSKENYNGSVFAYIIKSHELEKLISTIENDRIPAVSAVMDSVTIQKITLEGVLDGMEYIDTSAKESNLAYADALKDTLVTLVDSVEDMERLNVTKDIPEDINQVLDCITELSDVEKELSNIVSVNKNIDKAMDLIPVIDELVYITESMESIKRVKYSKGINYEDTLKSITILNDCVEDMGDIKEVKNCDISLLDCIETLNAVSSLLYGLKSTAGMEKQLESVRRELDSLSGKVVKCPIHGEVKYVNDECIPNSI